MFTYYSWISLISKSVDGKHWLVCCSARSYSKHWCFVRNINEPLEFSVALIGGSVFMEAQPRRRVYKHFLFWIPLDECCKSNNRAKMEKKRPPGTVEFIVSIITVICSRHHGRFWQGHISETSVFLQVGPNDSLNSIALKFNITPNKLVQLNKLFSRSIYPGQVRTLNHCIMLL